MRKLLLSLILISQLGAWLSAQSFFDTERLKINTRDFNEFGPVLIDSSLYFCSDRKSSFTRNTIYEDKIVYYFDIYMVKDTAKMKLSELPFEINTLSNDGPICFSPDKTEMYVSQNFASDPNVSNLSKVGIYSFKKEGNNWVERTPFAYNNTSWNTGHPCISPDGKTIYFSSDKPGGQGGFDIYYCRKVNGAWSEPVNAGPNVNSSKNEVSPFFHASQKLYFASDRDSLSGFDIYFTVIDGNQASFAEKLSEPINSKFNDFSFICDATGEKGYFSSNRKGSDDIYSFKSTFPEFTSSDSIQSNNYCFTFFEENTHNLDSLTLMYEWDFGDSKIRKKEADYCFPGPGNYEVNLNIIDSVTGEVYQNQANYTMNIVDAIQPVITFPENIKTGLDVSFTSEKSNLPGFDVQSFYWWFSDGIKYTGPQTTRTFEKPGLYKVWLGVILKDPERQTTFKKCVFVEFNVN